MRRAMGTVSRADSSSMHLASQTMRLMVMQTGRQQYCAHAPHGYAVSARESTCQATLLGACLRCVQAGIMHAGHVWRASWQASMPSASS